MNKQLVFQFLIRLWTLHLAVSAKPKMQLVLSSIEQCKVKEDLPVVINHWEIIQKEKSVYYVSGAIEVLESFPKGFEVHLVINKCPADARLGHCDTFINNFEAKNVCFIIEVAKNTAIQLFLDAVQPKIKCPLEAGNYTVTELKVADTLAQYLPQLGATSWHISITGYLNNREVGCIDITANVHARRNRG